MTAFVGTKYAAINNYLFGCLEEAGRIGHFNKLPVQLLDLSAEAGKQYIIPVHPAGWLEPRWNKSICEASFVVTVSRNINAALLVPMIDF